MLLCQPKVAPVVLVRAVSLRKHPRLEVDLRFDAVIETTGMQFRFYHEDEGSSVDNVAQVADDVVDILKDSPRTRATKVAVALYVLWSMLTVVNLK